MEAATKEYVVRNSLAYAYDALRSKERLIGESTNSHYENYFQQLIERLGPPGKRWDLNIGNSEVEQFYLGRISPGEFRLKTQSRVFSKIQGWDCAPLFTVIWSECCSAPDKVSLCAKLDSGVGRQIWEIFLYLDVDSQGGKVHIDDLCDLILRVLRENGHVESEQNIKEWFCEEILIDFWSFFTAIVENYAGLLKPKIIRALHELITSEMLLCGKLTKKGHKIHSWKERWFSLQYTQLAYFESQENMVLKGTIAIGVNTQFDLLPDSKGRQRRFRVTDDQTQVPYEICTPDSESLQQWMYGIKLAIAMNRVSGTNFLHRLTLAQKEVFPKHTTFSVSAVTPCAVTTPTSPTSHASLAPCKSLPLEKCTPQPPSPYHKSKSGVDILNQTSVPTPRVRNENFDDPPLVPQQRHVDITSVVTRQKPRGPAVRNAETKARRRHSSITYSSEFEREQEREQEREREKMDQVSSIYSVVTKPSKNPTPPTSPDGTIPPPALPEREVRRIRPKTPSPSAQRGGYIQLEFQNGTSNLYNQNQKASTPTPTKNRGMLPDIRTKWNYTTVVFDKEAQKEQEREFEENGGETTKRNKPLPPPPPGAKNSSSDSSLVTPPPVPRPRKMQSLTEIQLTNGQQRGPGDVEFSSTTTPTQNGNIRRELPKLPPKGNGERKRELPALPPKDNRGDSPTHKPLPRPRPPPRQNTMSPPTEAPPPIPARRPSMET